MQTSIDCVLLSVASSVFFVCINGANAVDTNVDVFSFQKAPIRQSISNYNGTFRIQTGFNPNDKDNPIIITVINNNGKSALSFSGHRSTEVMVLSNTCYYTKYAPMMPDCNVIAVDLLSAQKTWSRVVGLNTTMGFSLYSNSVKLQIQKNRLIVSGHESAGDYVYELDLASGKILEQRITLSRTPEEPPLESK